MVWIKVNSSSPSGGYRSSESLQIAENTLLVDFLGKLFVVVVVLIYLHLPEGRS